MNWHVRISWVYCMLCL